MISHRELAMEVEQVTRRIEEFFASDAEPVRERIEPIHVRYVECIETVNQRLRRCDELMRKGLRSEAIQECEVKPMLLDVVTQIDLPQADAWADVVREVGLASQPPILLNIAAELNRAYVDCGSLEELLRVHRLLALARSPLKDRIEVLRHLAAKDADNAVWREDIAQYETARLREVAAELAEIRKAADVEAARELYEELVSPAWSIAIPGDTIESAARLHRALVAQHARTDLERLAKELDQAFSAYDVEAGMVLQTRWDEAARLAELAPDDELAVQANAALDWLDDCARHRRNEREIERLQAELESLLDDDTATRSEIATSYHALERLEAEIPDRLQRRFQQRTELFDRGARRRTVGIVAVTVTTIAALAGVTLFIIHLQSEKRAVARARSALVQFLEQKQFQAAEQLVEGLRGSSPELLENPDIQRLIVEVEGGVTEEESRRSRFEQSIASAEAQLASDPSWESVAAADEYLRIASTLAEGNSEMLAVERVTGQIDEDRYALQRAIDEEFSLQLTQLTAQLGQLESLTIDDIQRIEVDAAHLREMPRVSRELRQGSQVNLLTDTIRQRREALSVAAARENSLREVRAATGDKAAYIKALRDYVALGMEDVRSEAFEKVIQTDVAYLETVRDWNVLCSRWSRVRLSLAPKDVEAPLKILREIKRDFADYPATDTLHGMREYFETIEQRASQPIDPLTELEQLLRSHLFDTQYVVEKEGMQRHYFLGEPIASGNTVSINALTNALDQNDIEVKRFRTVQLVRFGESALFTESPQRRFGRQALDRLARRNREPFEKIMCDILNDLQGTDQMDAIFRGGLLQVIADRAMANSRLLAEALKGYRDDIATVEQLNSENWMAAHTDTAMVALRDRVASQLSRVRRMPAEIYQTDVAPQLRDALGKKPRLPELEWVGVILRDEKGVWAFNRSPGKTFSGDSSIVIRAFESDGKSQFVEVGRIEGNEARLDKQQATRFVEGAIVYQISREY